MMMSKQREVIDAYNKGESMTSIAKRFRTYTTSIKRILEKHGVELRHDEKKEGQLYVKNGDKLIEWARAQGRLVTKAELAKQLGRKRLSPSYFIKYPELGKYVETHEQKDLQEHTSTLYELLARHGISYKPSDRTALNVTVDALLLDEYSGIAIHILEKPKCVSKKKFDDRIALKKDRAEKAKISLILPTKDQLNDKLIKLLDTYKRK